MTQEYAVNIWFEAEADVNIEAESEEEAIEEAKEAVKRGGGLTSSPTEDEILSARVLGTVDGGHIHPTE